MNERVRKTAVAITIVCGFAIAGAGLVDTITRPSDVVRGSSMKQEYLEKKNKVIYNKSRSIFDAKKNNPVRSGTDLFAITGGLVLVAVGTRKLKKAA